MRTLSNKIVPLAEAANLATRQKATNGTVVWTNGCFDLLHAGHVTYLEQARQLGDLLIVGVNSDTSVRRLKGKRRPIVPEHARQSVVAALESVDLVVLFTEDTPLDAILTIKPDIIVKGGDYQADTVVGAKESEAWGGRVEIIPLVPGWSTTSLAQKSDPR